MQPLQKYINKEGRQLRLGYTTGSCAAAAARAAALLLLGGQRVDRIRLQTPGGLPVEIDIELAEQSGEGVRCAVIKDAGDDPDITDGAWVGCTVYRQPQGFAVEGGEGVGRVTRPGLACTVGEAAVNPVPRQMILRELREAASSCGYDGGLRAVVDVPEGRALAAKTFNPRLGIEGGLSILGTSGLVEPMSATALIATIQAEIDSLAAAGRQALLIVPGNYGADFAKARWGFSLERGVKCSNYIGEALDYAVYKGFRQIVLLGHAGKLVKLAAGIMDTHSRTADGRCEILTAHAGLCGAPQEHLALLMECVTIDASDNLLCEWGLAEEVWASIAGRVAYHLGQRAAGAQVAFASFAARGIVMQGGAPEEMIREVLSL